MIITMFAEFQDKHFFLVKCSITVKLNILKSFPVFSLKTNAIQWRNKRTNEREKSITQLTTNTYNTRLQHEVSSDMSS